MEILGNLAEGLGLVLGSFVVAIGLSAGGWAVFSHARHPEWAEPSIVFVLVFALVTHSVSGQFLLMVTILMVIATPFMWIEGRAWRGCRSGEHQSSGFMFHKFW